MENKNYQLMSDDDIPEVIKALVINLCKQAYDAEAIGEYIALTVPAIEEARKPRVLTEAGDEH